MRAGAAEASVREAAAWVEAAGGSVGPLRAGSGPVGRGIFAARAIAAGERLLRVPPARLVTTAVAAATRVGQAVVERWERPAGDQVLLALFLVRALRKGDRAWSPYLATLPRVMPGHPLFFSRRELAELRGTSCGELVAARRERLDEERAQLRRIAPGLHDLQRGEWTLARALVASRAFTGERDEPALVPLADLLNHAPDPETRWDLGADGFVLEAVAPIPAGAEVRDSYGQKSNTRLLLHYGFVVPEGAPAECLVEVGELGTLVLRLDPAEAEARAMWGRVAASRGGPAALAAVCRARLAALPPADDPRPASAAGRCARVVREDERRVLSFWAERAGRVAREG